MRDGEQPQGGATAEAVPKHGVYLSEPEFDAQMVRQRLFGQAMAGNVEACIYWLENFAPKPEGDQPAGQTVGPLGSFLLGPDEEEPQAVLAERNALRVESSDLRTERNSYREGIDCALNLLNLRFEEGKTAMRVDEAHEALALAVEMYLDEEPDEADGGSN